MPLPLPCGCYDFDKEPEVPAECGHCWHEQFFVGEGLRKQCGRCGKWRDLFD